jgi:RimJ/RimL family protein N-acetyltransferase
MDDNDEIGTILFERGDPDKMSYVLGIYLNRIDLFGKGIGKKIIKSAMNNIISERDAQELYLDVRKENLCAFRCYESLEFKTVGDWEKNSDSGKIKVKRMKLLIEK